MAMNNKGQTALLAVMVGIFVFMFAMIVADPIKDVITEARGNSQLDCSNSTISDGNKMTCLMVDLILPYFIGVVLALAGAYLTAKFV